MDRFYLKAAHDTTVRHAICQNSVAILYLRHHHELAAVRHVPFGLLAKRVNELLLRVSLLAEIDTVRVPKDTPVIEELTAGHAESIFVI